MTNEEKFWMHNGVLLGLETALLYFNRNAEEEADTAREAIKKLIDFHKSIMNGLMTEKLHSNFMELMGVNEKKHNDKREKEQKLKEEKGVRDEE